jgi:transcriptional regulator of acetoin/glycerol metabolism
LTISLAARQALLDFAWPGNVRQMRNVLRTLAALCEGRIEFDDLPAADSPGPANPLPPCSDTAGGRRKLALLAALEQRVGT